MNSAITFAPTEAPRGARVAADLAFRLFRAVEALRFQLQAAPVGRAVEAGAVRRRAAEIESGGNAAFAADLYAAADRHQSGR